MNGTSLIREAAALRHAFQLNGRLQLEFLADLSKLLREHKVVADDRLISNLILAVPDELMNGMQAAGKKPGNGGSTVKPPQGIVNPPQDPTTKPPQDPTTKPPQDPAKPPQTPTKPPQKPGERATKPPQRPKKSSVKPPQTPAKRSGVKPPQRPTKKSSVKPPQKPTKKGRKS